MSRQISFWDYHSTSKLHQLRLIKKRQRIMGLLDLLNTWESTLPPRHPYIKQLRLKIRQAEHQLEAMKP